MKFSKYFLKTKKTASKDQDSKNARYFYRAGMVDKHMAGVYALLPLGLRVYWKIEGVIREEMNAVGGQEILMNVLQPKTLWDETGRFVKMDEIFYKTEGRSGKPLGLAPTHEEQVVDIARKYIDSYKDLPLSLYQMQVKFRNEVRAKSGLLRGREFVMKDMYSFHLEEDDFDQYYEKVKQAYVKLFARLGLTVMVVKASGGVFSEFSDEFQLESEIGEDDIYICDKCARYLNKEIVTESNREKCDLCQSDWRIVKGVEVGNIFPLGDKFARDMKFTVTNEDGISVFPIMGCYGIGLGRLMGVVVEKYYDEEKGKMMWPKELTPFDCQLISINKDDEAEDVYKKLIADGVDVLYDDREVSAGEKLKDADLIGCGRKIIVSQKSLVAGGVEWVDDYTKQTKIVEAGGLSDLMRGREG